MNIHITAVAIGTEMSMSTNSAILVSKKKKITISLLLDRLSSLLKKSVLVW